MKEEIYNEQELKALEEEIRAMGIPYSKNEPDERYFANFRVHLTERIDEKEKKHGIVTGIWEWLVSSPLRYLSLGATLAGIVIAVILVRQSPESEIAVIQPVQPKTENAAIIPQNAVKPDIAIAPKSIQVKPKHVQKMDMAVNKKTNTVLNEADYAADFANMDATLTVAESDDPVNLENLSESELESVVTIAQDMK